MLFITLKLVSSLGVGPLKMDRQACMTGFCGVYCSCCRALPHQASSNCTLSRRSWSTMSKYQAEAASETAMRGRGHKMTEGAKEPS
ncbi:hypothetical protein PoB_007477700 [Plakobranchus ocellatus]|uniref:Secreted protein n=1 Tax=Plakobranchus ocellatus TaxID=259542 RepID=A0AAV4DVE4_9GAST|nr:hypothetical protein PoB_007477700 [Plakobranchus ocellatus]